MRIFVFLVLAALVLGIVVLFSVQNSAPVTVSFYNWRFSQSLAVVILLALLLGAAIMALVFLSIRVRGRFKKKVAPGAQRRDRPAPGPAGDASETDLSGQEKSTTPPRADDSR